MDGARLPLVPTSFVFLLNSNARSEVTYVATRRVTSHPGGGSAWGTHPGEFLTIPEKHREEVTMYRFSWGVLFSAGPLCLLPDEIVHFYIADVSGESGHFKTELSNEPRDAFVNTGQQRFCEPRENFVNTGQQRLCEPRENFVNTGQQRLFEPRENFVNTGQQRLFEPRENFVNTGQQRLFEPRDDFVNTGQQRLCEPSICLLNIEQQRLDASLSCLLLAVVDNLPRRRTQCRFRFGLVSSRELSPDYELWLA
uniref:Uncharacterized protein n=1 Tax=Timema tahoe TaxID=61484 RepID=A0A7R9IP39_9NEOP|nr:unnamed protein product [Timema tahoe]